MLSQHALQVVSQHALQQVLGRGVSRPTPKGEVEGDLVQVHSQGVKLMGIWSRPTAKGEVEGDLAGVGGGACSRGVPGLGDAWSQGGVPGPGGVPGGDPQRATAVGGTHPTGMHSFS